MAILPHEKNWDDEDYGVGIEIDTDAAEPADELDDDKLQVPKAWKEQKEETEQYFDSELVAWKLAEQSAADAAAPDADALVTEEDAVSSTTSASNDASNASAKDDDNAPDPTDVSAKQNNDSQASSDVTINDEDPITGQAPGEADEEKAPKKPGKFQRLRQKLRLGSRNESSKSSAFQSCPDDLSGLILPSQSYNTSQFERVMVYISCFTMSRLSYPGGQS